MIKWVKPNNLAQIELKEIDTMDFQIKLGPHLSKFIGSSLVWLNFLEKSDKL